MRFAKPRRSWLRALVVERCEDRLLMSAQPVGENLIDATSSDWSQAESLSGPAVIEMEIFGVAARKAGRRGDNQN